MCKGRKVEVFNGTGRLGPDHVVTVTAADGSTTEITGTTCCSPQAPCRG